MFTAIRRVFSSFVFLLQFLHKNLASRVPVNSHHHPAAFLPSTVWATAANDFAPEGGATPLWLLRWRGRSSWSRAHGCFPGLWQVDCVLQTWTSDMKLTEMVKKTGIVLCQIRIFGLLMLCLSFPEHLSGGAWCVWTFSSLFSSFPSTSSLSLVVRR